SARSLSDTTSQQTTSGKKASATLQQIFHSSSVVEQSVVNRSVAGSNPACGAIRRSTQVAEEAPLLRVSIGFAGARVQIPPSPPFYKWPVGQVVKTSPFHGGITGSNPVRVIIFYK